ncbi:MAG: hypothetical protein H0X50_05760 [Nitrosopumilus sp.]|nr:hypothetical protein [Nitrosopumilus sp.]
MEKKFNEEPNPCNHPNKYEKNMKKKIKILKNKLDNDSYTFLNEENAFSLKPYDVFHRDNGLHKKTGKEKYEEKFKKKKAANKESMAKSPKGLKFSNPSQRNHSSIYE